MVRKRSVLVEKVVLLEDQDSFGSSLRQPVGGRRPYAAGADDDV